MCVFVHTVITFVVKPLYDITLYFLLDKYLRVEGLGHRVGIGLTSKETIKLLLRLVAPFCTSSSSI